MDFESAAGSSVEIDLGDLEREEDQDLLVSEVVLEEAGAEVQEPIEDSEVAAAYEEMDELLAAGCDFANEYTITPKRNWLRRAFACGFFVAAFWLAHAQLAPWLD